MMISDLDAEHEIYQELSKANKKLLHEQETIIQSYREEAMPLIEWYLEKDFIFTHPDIGYRYAKGPILGFDQDENELIVYNPEKGFRKINIENNEDCTAFIPNIIKEGHFESAIKGFKYLEEMLEKYSKKVQSSNEQLQSEIDNHKVF